MPSHRNPEFLVKQFDKIADNAFFGAMMLAMLLTAVLCHINKWSIVANIMVTLVDGLLAGLVGYVVAHKWVAPLLLSITREEVASLAVYYASENERLIALEERRDALYEARCNAQKVDLMTTALTSAAVRAVATTVGSHVFGVE
jgi:hypothetical protein